MNLKTNLNLIKLLPKKYYRNALICLLVVGNSAVFNAQTFDKKALKKLPIYTLAEARHISPEQVFRLDLKKAKLTELPKEIYQFKNLRYLDVSHNNLTEIPLKLSTLTQLEYLDFSSNTITTVSDDIKQFTALKILLLNHNEIVTLPAAIGALTNLTELHLWGTLIVNFPSSFILLKDTLKTIDLRFVPMTRIEHKKWKKALPFTNIAYSLKCNCD